MTPMDEKRLAEIEARAASDGLSPAAAAVLVAEVRRLRGEVVADLMLERDRQRAVIDYLEAQEQSARAERDRLRGALQALVEAADRGRLSNYGLQCHRGFLAALAAAREVLK